MSVKGRTVRQLQSQQDVWNTIDQWAAGTGYALNEQDGPSRTYQRGTGALVAPQMVKVTATQGGYSIEGWVRIPLISRIFTFMLIPEEMIVDKGGFVGVIPRNKAREDLNKLLVSLGVEPLIA